MNHMYPLAYAYFAMGFQSGCIELSNRGISIVDLTDKFAGEINMVQSLMDEVPHLVQHFGVRTDNDRLFDGVFTDDVAEPLGRNFVYLAHLHDELPSKAALVEGLDDIIDERLISEEDKRPFSVPEINAYFDESTYIRLTGMLQLASHLFGDGGGWDLGKNEEYERGQVELICDSCNIPVEHHCEVLEAIYTMARELRK